MTLFSSEVQNGAFFWVLFFYKLSYLPIASYSARKCHLEDLKNAHFFGVGPSFGDLPPAFYWMLATSSSLALMDLILLPSILTHFLIFAW